VPRIENMGENVQRWCEDRGCETGTTCDVCASCYGRLETDPHAFDARLAPRAPGEPRGLDGWGGDVEHAPYAYGAVDCAACGARLTTLDDRRSLDCCSTPERALASHCAVLDVRREPSR